MGTLTYTDIEDEVRSGLGGRTDINARLTRIINLSQMRIARLHRWEELETIYTNTTPFTSDINADKYIKLPDTFRDMYSLLLLDGTRSRKLTYIPHRVWDRQTPSPDAFTRRKPIRYTIWRRTIELYPVAEKSYSLEGRVIEWPTAFAGTGTPGQLSSLDNKDDMIIALSLSWAFKTLGEDTKANSWWNIYRNMANTAVGEEVEMPDLDQLPGPSVEQSQVTPNPWADPFVRSIRTS